MNANTQKHLSRALARLALTACALAFLASIVGLAEGVGAPAAAYMVGSVLIANHAAGVLLEDERRR